MTATTKRSVAVVGGLAGVLIILLLAWVGGELHYRNCLTDADLRYPVASGLSPADHSDRADAVAGCSRWP